MNVTFATTRVREVEEIENHELPLPYYGRQSRSANYVRILPIMWDHLPDRLRFLDVLEVKTSTGGATIRRKRISCYPVVPASVASLIARYTQVVSTEDFVAGYTKSEAALSILA
jgi:hypothetical protein